METYTLDKIGLRTRKDETETFRISSGYVWALYVDIAIGKGQRASFTHRDILKICN